MRKVRIDFDREGNVVNHAISEVIKLERNQVRVGIIKEEARLGTKGLEELMASDVTHSLATIPIGDKVIEESTQ